MAKSESSLSKLTPTLQNELSDLMLAPLRCTHFTRLNGRTIKIGLQMTARSILIDFKSSEVGKMKKGTSSSVIVQ